MRLALYTTFLVAPLLAMAAPAEDQAQQDRLVLEVIKRVKDFDMAKASPKVKESLSRFLATNRGSKEYFSFLERFTVAEEAPALLEYGLSKAGTVEAANAFKTLVKMGQVETIKSALLKTAPAKLGAVLDTLSLSQSREAAAVILQVVSDPKATPELKSAAIHSLGKSRNGENLLLDAVKQNALPAELKFAAGEVLHASSDKGIQQAAAQLIPMPKAAGDKPLPPISKLITRTGDATKGRVAYNKLCLTCHIVNQEGIDFGPALSEIGTKLPKEALYAAIFDPSAAISFGYEGFELKTKKGDTYIGMMAGETDAEVSLKVPGGVVIKTPRSDVAEKKKLEASLMPAGLVAAFSEEELVDLVEYLVTLKKK
jgi:putative heme-binding domain-containing protein